MTVRDEILTLLQQFHGKMSWYDKQNPQSDMADEMNEEMCEDVKQTITDILKIIKEHTMTTYSTAKETSAIISTENRMLRICDDALTEELDKIPEGVVMADNILAIGNDELEKMPPLGKTVKCWMCGKRHIVRYAERVMGDGTKQPSKLLAFFRCGGETYLCGLKGKEWRPTEEAR